MAWGNIGGGRRLPSVIDGEGKILMAKVRAPKTDLEKAFKEVYDEVGAEIEEHLIQAKKLSDKHGIPFGTYVPKSFMKTFFAKGCDADNPGEIHWDDASDMNDELVNYVGKVAPVDSEFWYSSTADCEIFR